MRLFAKPTIALASAVILLSGLLGQTALAQSAILTPGTLPTGGYAVNPQEYLTINWSVTPVGNDFLYVYTISNPAGDVKLNPDGTLTQTPETVDTFQLSFNSLAPGALVPNSITGGIASGHDANGITWLIIPSIPAGGNSGALTFESADAPILGNAQALDASAPSPWSSVGIGGEVAVPNTISTVPEPATTALFTTTALILLPFRSKLRQIFSQKRISSR